MDPQEPQSHAMAEALKDLAISQSGFVFDPKSGVTFSVNATGQFILLRLRDGLALEAVEAALAETFELGESDDAHRDLREFTGLLRDQGVLPRLSAVKAGPELEG